MADQPHNMKMMAGFGGDRLFSGSMAMPGVIIVACLVVFAPLMVLFLAFRINDGSLLGTGATLHNFSQIATDPLYAMLILRSLLIAGLVTALTVITAYPVAWYLAFRAGPRRGLILFLVTLPFWTSYLLRVFAWKIVLAFNGVLNSLLMMTGLIDQPVMFLNTPGAVMLTLAHAYAPFAILPIYVALETIPKSLFEAAADLGATPSIIARRIVLPLSMPGVLSAALVVFVPTVGDYVTPAMVGGPASTMVGSMIQAQFGKANDWPFGAALAVTVMLVILAMVLIARRADAARGGAA